MNITQDWLDEDCELHIAKDQDFFAVICLHPKQNLRALGGCRFLPYENQMAAIMDAKRLSLSMRRKASISELPYSGGKAVIKYTDALTRDQQLRRFAEMVDALQGRYIATIDSGTTQEDMGYLKQCTPYITGELATDGTDNDPSLSTALGVFAGLQAGLQHYFQKNTLQGVRIALQGVGHVGTPLAKRLHAAGADLIVCDQIEERARLLAQELQCRWVKSDAIYDVECDVFSPCGLGRILNAETLPRLKARMIAGAANDQLANADVASALQDQEIVYLPDYLINAGGLIHLAELANQQSLQQIAKIVERIQGRLLQLAKDADSAGVSLLRQANQTADRV